MLSLPFMSMELYIKKGGSLTWEEKMYGQYGIAKSCVGP
jgi:hypothetical protein